MNRFSWEFKTKTQNAVKYSGIFSRMLWSRYLFSCLLFLIWYICIWFVGAQLLRIESKEGIYLKSQFIKEVDSASTLREIVATTPHEPKVLIFYSSYCTYCYIVSNSLKRVAEYLKSTGIKFYAFECGKGYSECSFWGIDGFPSLRLIHSRNETINLHSLNTYTEFSNINCTRRSEKFIEFSEGHTPKFIDIPYNNVQGKSVSMPVINEERFTLCSLIRAFNLADIYKPIHPSSLISTSLVTLNNPGTKNKQGRWNDESLQINPSYLVVDAIIAKFYILRNWIFLGNNATGTNQYLEKRRLNALYRFVETSWVLIPSKRTRIKLGEILLFLKSYLSNEDNCIYSKLSLEKWQTFINSVFIEGLTFIGNNEPNFHVCKSVFCGLWLLFHIWSISLLQGVKKQGTGCPIYNGPSLTPGQVVSRIADTVQYFLVCQSCREHFDSMIKNNTCDRNSFIPPTNGDKFPILLFEAEGLVFWLYRIHNLVTFRVATESSYHFMKQKRSSSVSYVGVEVSFPPLGLCRECYRDNQIPAEVTNEMLSNINELSDSDFDKDIFNQEPVISFLEYYYWKKGWILPRTTLNFDLVRSESMKTDLDLISDPFSEKTSSPKGSAESRAGSVFDVFPVLYPILTFFIFSLTVFYLVETGSFLQEQKLISI